MSSAANAIEIQKIQQELANSIKLSSLSGSQRKQIEDAIHPEITPGFRAWKGSANEDYSAWQNGDKVFEIASDDLFYLGRVKDASDFDPSDPADLNDITKFDRYMKNAKAVI